MECICDGLCFLPPVGLNLVYRPYKYRHWPEKTMDNSPPDSPYELYELDEQRVFMTKLEKPKNGKGGKLWESKKKTISSLGRTFCV